MAVVRSYILAALVAFSWRATAAVSFVSPPPYLSEDTMKNNPVYAEGTNVQISWTVTEDSNVPLSLYFYQSNISSDGIIAYSPDQTKEYILRTSITCPSPALSNNSST